MELGRMSRCQTVGSVWKPHRSQRRHVPTRLRLPGLHHEDNLPEPQIARGYVGQSQKSTTSQFVPQRAVDYHQRILEPFDF